METQTITSLLAQMIDYSERNKNRSDDRQTEGQFFVCTKLKSEVVEKFYKIIILIV